VDGTVKNPVHLIFIRGYMPYKTKEKQLAHRRNYYAKNRERIKKINKEYRDSHPEMYKSAKLKQIYGIDLTQYNDMFKKQDGLCAICLKPETEEDYRTHNIRMLNVDHNHITGKIRGLLCQKCNKGIGCLNDNAQILRNAIKYLEGESNATN
jgi:hypothetical protein